MKYVIHAAILTALLAPFAAYAAPRNIAEILNIMTQVVLLLVPTAALLLVFFWNLSQLVFTINDAEKKKQARMRMIWSVVAMFVVFSLAGLVQVLQITLFGESASIEGI